MQSNAESVSTEKWHDARGPDDVDGQKDQSPSDQEVEKDQSHDEAVEDDGAMVVSEEAKTYEDVGVQAFESKQKALYENTASQTTKEKKARTPKKPEMTETACQYSD